MPRSKTNKDDLALGALVPVAQGGLPATLEDCTALMQAAALAEHVPGAVRCIAIARARQLYEDERAGEWIEWVLENWPALTSKSEVHHKRTIGDLLLHHRQSGVYPTLLQLAQDKLRAIARLPQDKVVPFLEAGDPRGQTRDQVRARVCKWMGETLPNNTKQLTAKKTQGDFFALLEGMTDWDEWAAELDNTKAATATFASLQIIRAASTQYDDEDRAEAARLLRAEADRIEKGQ